MSEDVLQQIQRRDRIQKGENNNMREVIEIQITLSIRPRL